MRDKFFLVLIIIIIRIRVDKSFDDPKERTRNTLQKERERDYT